MIDFLRKILVLSLFFIIITSVSSCFNNINENKSSQKIHTYFNDFEEENQNSIWKNQYVKTDSSAFSGNNICECPADQMYAFGFDLPIVDSIGNRNAIFTFDMMLKSEVKPNAQFVLSVQNGNKNVLWKAFDFSNGFDKENQWYKANFEFNIPNDIIKGSSLNCYILNDKFEHFYIDDFSFSIEYYNMPTYVNEIVEYESPKHLKSLTENTAINLLYSEKENKIIIADNNQNNITKPLSMFYSLVVNNDTTEIQFADWELLINVNENKDVYKFKNDNKIVVTELTISIDDNDSNVNFDLESTYLKDAKVIKSSLIFPFLNDDFTVYRRNPFVDSVNYQDVYYLDKEGFSLNLERKQLNLYHPENVSSIQLDTKKSIAYINSDYHYDHLLIRYELLDTSDYYIDNSATLMKKSTSHNSSFSISLTDKTELPRIMPIMNGYESAFIWTEHADWADIKTHRATYFGSEKVENIEDAVGGFAYYNIPVTKSVFYNNPDSVTNYEKNNDFPGLHSTIMTDSLFFDFLNQLKNKGFDICLHTPEQYTTTQENLSEALSFMKNNFASPSWIDHGYNNSELSNRENMVCDGLDSSSPYYAYELWKANGVKYFFNASYEEIMPRPFSEYIFENYLFRPYPGFGDALPLPKVSTLPMFPEILLWSTPYTMEPGETWAWDYYFEQYVLDKLVDYRYVFITHIYPAWVEEGRGYWEMKDGKYVAKEGFNSALEKIAAMEKEHLLLPTTIADYMTYQQQLQSLEYKVEADGTVVLRNKNEETIKGLSLISTHDISFENEKHFNIRKTKSGEENIIWFDMEPGEVVRVVNNNKKN